MADVSESPVGYFEKEQLPELGLDYVDALSTHHSNLVSEEFFLEKIWKRMEDMQKRNKTRYLAVNSGRELFWVRDCIVRGECARQDYVLLEQSLSPCFARAGSWWLYDKDFVRRYVVHGDKNGTSFTGHGFDWDTGSFPFRVRFVVHGLSICRWEPVVESIAKRRDVSWHSVVLNWVRQMPLELSGLLSTGILHKMIAPPFIGLYGRGQ